MNDKEKMEKVITKEQSKNSRAESLMGLRPEGFVPFSFPSEEGYRCPICGYTGDNLHWSEYHGFIWCEECNKDIPSPLCLGTDIERATEIFLDIVEMIKGRESRGRLVAERERDLLLECILNGEQCPIEEKLRESICKCTINDASMCSNCITENIRKSAIAYLAAEGIKIEE